MPARWRNMPLRIRLTVLFVGLLTVLLIALGSFVYFDTQSFLVTTTAQQLQQRAEPGVERSTRGFPRPPASGSSGATVSPAPATQTPPALSEYASFLAQSQSNPGTTGTVLGPDGQVMADGRTLPEQPLAATPDRALVARALTGERGLYYATDISGQHTLVLLIPLQGSTAGAAPIGVLQLSSRLDLVDQVLTRQQILIVVGIIVTILLGTAGGLWLTESALAPLKWMIATCRRIAGGDLSQRVNLPHRGDEIGQLAATFDEMVEQLEATFARQRQFIADASHELRTPLTVLSGSLDVLLMAPEGDPEAQHRMLSGMRRELARLTRLVNDLLMLNRLDVRQGLRSQTVDLAALARQVAEEIKPVAGDRTIEVNSTGETRVQGDADRFKQVLLNLVDNDIRFTDPDKGIIRVGVNQVGKHVRLTVWDNGSGVPGEALPHLFERFYRVDKARARASGGSGLGLAIVKAIIEAHGGTVAPVKSAPGQGTTFEFSIPQGDVTKLRVSSDGDGAGDKVQAKN